VVANSLQVTLGGQGGSSGNGGRVIAGAAQNVSIVTAGSGSYGVWAQSVGGGGGQAGGIGIGIIDSPFGSPPPNTIGVVIGRGSKPVNGTGAGGMVSAYLDSSSVSSTGSDAIGIFAQSGGGGGGESGQNSADCISNCSYIVGSTGGAGNGGAVDVSLVNGSITTTGQYSHGIFAQSAGGQGSSAGPVTVSVSGVVGSVVSAAGDGASGIFADSSGGGSNGNISISIGANSTVSGGIGNAAGVRLIDGLRNMITNAGTITTVAGANGVAVRADGTGRTSVANYGSIIGSVYLGGAGNSFLNEASGLFTPGAQVNLGAGGVLRNLGELELDGVGQTETTDLTGSLVQESSGRLVFDVDGPQPGEYDTLSVGGDADLLGGTIEIDFLKGLAANSETFDFITADTLEASDLNWDVTGLGPGFDYSESVENGALVFTVSTTSVPELPTSTLLGVGLLGLTFFRPRKRLSASPADRAVNASTAELLVEMAGYRCLLSDEAPRPENDHGREQDADRDDAEGGGARFERGGNEVGDSEARRSPQGPNEPGADDRAEVVARPADDQHGPHLEGEARSVIVRGDEADEMRCDRA
jgi:hypothetical protein